MANKNTSLKEAKAAKNDEFYTQYPDIQTEVNAYIEYNPDVFRGKTILLPCDDPEWSNFTKFFALNFEKFGLKKLISTSYAVESKKYKDGYCPSLFEQNDEEYDPDKTRIKGKIFTLTQDENNDGRVNIDDLKWHYLEGDGDFRSPEVRALRDESDIIVTNPPFSLFREFVAWLIESKKKFSIIGNQGAAGYKEIFPLVQSNTMWLGATGYNKDMVFRVPPGSDIKEADRQKAAKLGYPGDFTRMGNTCWFTNIDHGRRHEPIGLMTMADNIKFSKHKEVKGIGYIHYENFDAIDIPFTDAIPSDYDGCMGVPITFLDKYCPEHFEIIGLGSGYLGQSIGITGIPKEHKQLMRGHSAAGDLYMMVNGKPVVPYARILIRNKK